MYKLLILKGDVNPVIDLTPFGFTPTESAAYSALVRHGPMSGYDLGRLLSIARANAYQALDGLVAKKLVTRQTGRPRLYRAIDPAAALALIAQRQATLLDRLEDQISRPEGSGEPAILELAGRRAVLEVALRTAARSREPLRCLAPAAFLTALEPAWNKRRAEGLPTELWILGEGQHSIAGTRGSVSYPSASHYFHRTDPAVLLTSTSALLVTTTAEPMSAHWTSHPLLVGACHAALDHLTATGLDRPAPESHVQA